MTNARPYTSGAIAIANLSASIAGLAQLCERAPTFDAWRTLAGLLFLRGDLLGRIADHDRAEAVAELAIAMVPATAAALFLRAQLAGRFHRFAEAERLLDEARAAGHPRPEVDAERAALFQATGRYEAALDLRAQAAERAPTLHTLGALASLLADAGRWPEAEATYRRALDADEGVSPLPAAQLLFEWAVGAMRNCDLDRAEAIFAELARLLPGHVPGRGHHAEVALARGQLDAALALITPLVALSDDPEYRATRAEILAARGDAGAHAEAERAGHAYEALLARRPEAYADHGAAFFAGIGNRPRRALELARANLELRDTPRARRLLARAEAAVRKTLAVAGGAA